MDYDDIDLDGLPSTEDPIEPPVQQPAVQIAAPPPPVSFPAICYGAFISQEDTTDRSVENNMRTYNGITTAHMSIRELALNKVATALNAIDPIKAVESAESTAVLVNLAGSAISIAGQNEKSALQLAAANKRLLSKSDNEQIGAIVTQALIVMNRAASDTGAGVAVDTHMDDLLDKATEGMTIPEGMLVRSNDEGIPEEYAPKA